MSRCKVPGCLLAAGHLRDHVPSTKKTEPVDPYGMWVGKIAAAERPIDFASEARGLWGYAETLSGKTGGMISKPAVLGAPYGKTIKTHKVQIPTIKCRLSVWILRYRDIMASAGKDEPSQWMWHSLVKQSQKIVDARWYHRSTDLSLALDVVQYIYANPSRTGVDRLMWGLLVDHAARNVSEWAVPAGQAGAGIRVQVDKTRDTGGFYVSEGSRSGRWTSDDVVADQATQAEPLGTCEDQNAGGLFHRKSEYCINWKPV